MHQLTWRAFLGVTHLAFAHSGAQVRFGLCVKREAQVSERRSLDSNEVWTFNKHKDIINKETVII